MSVDSNVQERLKPNPHRYPTRYARCKCVGGLRSDPKPKVSEQGEERQNCDAADKPEFFTDDGEDEIVVSGRQKQVLLPALEEPLPEPASHLKPKQSLTDLVGFLLIGPSFRQHQPTSDSPSFQLV